jgi:universal stress protein F
VSSGGSGAEGGPPFEHVAVCVDASEATAAALRLARRLRAPEGRLRVVHVVPPPFTATLGWGGMSPPDLIGAAEELIDGIIEGLPEAEREQAESVVLSGHPPSTVIEWAHEAGPDLLVTAAHGGLLKRLAMGSFSSHLAYHSPCSVAVARPDAPADDAAAGFALVGACVDDSEPAPTVLEVAERLVGPDGRLVAVHVVPTAAYLGSPWTIDIEVLQEASEALVGELVAGTRAEPVILNGHAGAAVCDWAESEGADLLVAGAHRGLTERALLGSFAAYLAHHAPCDAILLRPSED